MTRQRVAVRESLSTVRTRLGFVLMRLLMPFKLRPRLVNLTAVAHEVFLLRLLIQVNARPMVQHIRVSAKALVAVRAFDGHRAGVNPLVLHQSLPLHESLRTEATRVNANVEVMLEVERERVPTVECFLAQRALGRVDLKVFVQQLQRPELLVALGAHVSPFNLQSERRQL